MSEENSSSDRPRASDQNRRRIRPGRRGARLLTFGVLIAIVLLGIAAISAYAVNNETRSTAAPPTSMPSISPPTGLYATGTNEGTVLLSWQPPLHSPIGYRIYRSTDHHGPYTIIGTVTDPRMDTFTDDNGIAPGMTYAYTVTAFTRQGESNPVGPIIAIVLPPPAPSATIEVPTPLPTFAPPSPEALTAVAKQPKEGTPIVAAAASPTVGVPTTLPTSVAGTSTPAIAILTPTATPATHRPPTALPSHKATPRP